LIEACLMRPLLRYRHTQFGTAIVAPPLLAAVLAVGVGTLTGFTLIAVIGVAPIAMFLALFYRLAVEIDATGLSFLFGIGLIRKRISPAEIADTRPVRDARIRGRKIRRTPRGGPHDGSGREAVEIALTSGQRLGTDESRRWALALQATREDARRAAA
jgi:hypothetical protein